MLSHLRFAMISGLVFAGAAQAATYVPAPSEPGKSGLTFAINYTAGVHEGITSIVEGALDLDPAKLEIQGGEIGFPISALDSGNEKRNCHILESLGLDYTHSVYPKDHVCAAENRLPPDGPNSVVFPRISFTFRAPAKNGNVSGVFSLHGVEKELTVPVTVTAEAGGKIRVKSAFSIHLPDYGVIVKKFIFVTVADDARIAVDLLLQPKGVNTAQ
jgi:polyisoprenoid-binding protein YceI